ncbi:MAG: ABC transporter substrate-binding protein, partial [Rhodospirillaceae bacterium]|nr:ABC transporter substrate-binding protein [Rhodospirillaceae bacterium]
MTDNAKKIKSEKKTGSTISRRQFTTGVAAAGAVASVGPWYIKNARAADPLKVGVLLPRSGGQAQIGIDCQRGADAALPILKNLGYPEMKFMLADFETKVDIARTQTAKLIDEGAQIIVGAFDSGATMAAAQVCEQ